MRNRSERFRLAIEKRSLVHFTGLSDAQLGEYLATRSWREHSGAYAIQEQGDPYVRVVEGGVSNVIGLPL
jgi:septum formation protein